MIQRRRAIVGDERAGRGEVLAECDLLRVVRPVLRVEVQLPRALDVGVALADRIPHARKALANAGIQVRVKPAGRLHDVRVGIVHWSRRVRHDATIRRSA